MPPKTSKGVYDLKTKLISLFSVIIIIISGFCFTVSAEKLPEYNVNFDLPNEFIIFTKDNAEKNSQALNSLGFTSSSFKKYISDNNIIMFASLKDKSCQITVNAVKTRFSEQTEDFAYIDDEILKNLIPDLFAESINSFKIETVNENKFIINENLGNDNASDFSYVQYVTVKNGLLYTVTVAFSSEIASLQNTNYVSELMQSFVINKQREKITAVNIQNVAIYVILVLIILFLLFVVIYIVYTFVNDIIKNRNTSDVAPYVKIKRRKFK